MREMHRWLVAAGTLAFLAACSDSPMEPTSPVGVAQFSEHLRQAGQSDTWHGYGAPALEIEDGPELCATWTDYGSLEDKLEELYGLGTPLPSGEPPNHYSYDFELWDEVEGEWNKVATVNGDPADDMTGCLDLSGWDPGVYDFRVKGIAHVELGTERSNHHTVHAFEQVTVGGVAFAFVIIDGNAGSVSDGEIVGTPNGNTWNLWIQLHYGGSALDCTSDLPAELEEITLTWETSLFTGIATWDRDVPGGQNSLRCEGSGDKEGWFRVSAGKGPQDTWPDSGAIEVDVVYDGDELPAGTYSYDLSE